MYRKFQTCKKVLSFTLAETLIVIGVIGIVSALTLPNLNNSTGDKERVAKVKKIHQNLNDALGRAEAVYGPLGEWRKSSDNTFEKQSKRFGERITEFIKIQKNCETNTSDGCFSNERVKLLGGSDANVGTLDTSSTYYKIITSDGTSLAFKVAFTSNGLFSSDIYVDIDGPSKGPNTLGMDIFYFYIDENEGIVPKGNDMDINQLYTKLKGISLMKTYAYYSTTWILKYDNADYLEFGTTSDKKCKNGTIPTEANPSCK